MSALTPLCRRPWATHSLARLCSSATVSGGGADAGGGGGAGSSPKMSSGADEEPSIEVSTIELSDPAKSANHTVSAPSSSVASRRPDHLFVVHASGPRRKTVPVAITIERGERPEDAPPP